MNTAPSLEVGTVDRGDRARLVDWLDDGLREGRRGRLEAEYPVSLAPGRWASHRVICDEGKLLSHAMYHVVDGHAPRPIRVGMIGLVYSDPAARGLGLASRCIEACCESLEHEGASLALLWSDKPAFYARLGFHPFGQEVRWVVDADICREARRFLDLAGSSRPWMLDSPRSKDWPLLEALYARKRFRIDREPGALRALAAAPETLCVVARQNNGQAMAYAALGRGDDFHGVVHEWAGQAPPVLACIEGLCEARGPLVVHAGPEPGPIGVALTQAGAQTLVDDFALGRVLDATRPPPSTFYLWGFDSI